jgi:hypothetical protein
MNVVQNLDRNTAHIGISLFSVDVIPMIRYTQNGVCAIFFNGAIHLGEFFFSPEKPRFNAKNKMCSAK